MDYSDSSHLKDPSLRKAVVTGGGSGIGKSIVHALQEAGFQTVTADIKAPEDLPGHFFRADLTRPEQIDDFCTKVVEATGMPDVLVCNAGQGIHEKLTEGNPSVWEHIFQLNVFSTLRLIRAFVPEMIKRETGDVVFISSVASRHAYAYGGIYAATKAAIDCIAETLRLEVQPAVRITVIHPGVVDTSFFDDMINGSQTPASIGWGALKPQEIADSVLFALTRPRDVMLNDIVIRPAAQPM